MYEEDAGGGDLVHKIWIRAAGSANSGLGLPPTAGGAGLEAIHGSGVPEVRLGAGQRAGLQSRGVVVGGPALVALAGREAVAGGLR